MNEYRPPTSDDEQIWDLWLTGLYQGTIVAADDAGIFGALAERPLRSTSSRSGSISIGARRASCCACSRRSDSWRCDKEAISSRTPRRSIS